MMNLVHDEFSAKAADQKLFFYSCIDLYSSESGYDVDENSTIPSAR